MLSRRLHHDTNNSAIAINMTSAMDIIRFALRQPTILQKRQLYSRQKLGNKNFRRNILKEDKSKICVFDNSKSE
jgi:hypothetical protein